MPRREAENRARHHVQALEISLLEKGKDLEAKEEYKALAKEKAERVPREFSYRTALRN